MGSSRCPRSIRTASWMFIGRPQAIRASLPARIGAPGADPGEPDVFRPLVFLENLVGDAGDDPIHSLGVHDQLPSALLHLSCPLWSVGLFTAGQKKTPRAHGEVVSTDDANDFHPL